MSLTIPALRGDDPLGFLASIGILSLSEQAEISPLRISWSAGGSPILTLEGPETIEALVDELGVALAHLSDREAVIPDVEPAFPISTTGSKDPMRMEREAMRDWYEAADQSWFRDDNRWMGRWLISLAAHSAVKGEDRGDVELTPFYAPTGRMTLRGSVFEAALKATAEIGGPGDALTHWRRVGFDGANFDERAIRDGGATTSGKPGNEGAPSPTWLATMAMRFFPITDSGRVAAALRWERIRLLPGYTTRSLVWPVWAPPLDGAAVRTLFGHPALRLDMSGEYPVPRDVASLPGLGVTALYGASRRTRSQGDGPLGPAVRAWPR